LSHFIPGAPIVVEANASDYAISAILSISCNDKQIHPVAFYSQSLTTSGVNYDTCNKELMAIFIAFKVWEHYMEGAAPLIDVTTDLQTLEHFSMICLLS